MLLDEDAARPRPLDYAGPLLARVRSMYMVVVGAVVLLAGAVAGWCLVHTVQVIVEVQHAVRSRPIDFNRSFLGLPVEKAIPLGIFSGGVALVALVHFIRLWNSRKAARPAA